MAKHHRQLRAGQNRDVATVEQTETHDDSLLPDAAEIEKLHALDPDILNWLKERAEKEQDFRHNAYTKRLSLIDGHNSREHNSNRMALIIYFVLMGACLYVSYLLIQQGKNIQGSIFGGTGLALALAVLITRREPKKPAKD